jgi:hypothetical protein
MEYPVDSVAPGGAEGLTGETDGDEVTGWGEVGTVPHADTITAPINPRRRGPLARAPRAFPLWSLTATGYQRPSLLGDQRA